MWKSLFVSAWRNPVARKRVCYGLGAVSAGIGAYYMLNKRVENLKCFARETYISKDAKYQNYLEGQLQKVSIVLKDRSDDWKPAGEKNGCKISIIGVPDSSFYAIKGSTVINTRKSVKKLLLSFSDLIVDEKRSEVYKRVSPNNIYMRVLQAFRGHRYLTHSRWTTNSWLIQDRDMVMLGETKCYGNRYGYSYGGSVDQHLKDVKFYPQDKQCTRGDMKLFAWHVKRISRNQVLVEYVTHTDPKGFIPAFLYNRVATIQAMACLKMIHVVLGEECVVTE